jgi:hypothetical protein
MSGNIYIASMNLRGVHATCPDGSTKLNVTSAQPLASKNRRDFSPMTAVHGGYLGFHCFENWWQSKKVYEHVPHTQTEPWWSAQQEPHRRYPGSKGKKVLGALHNGALLDYVSSRKILYVPYYYNLVQNREMLLYWIDQVQHGHDVTVYDFDGPRTDDGGVTCLPITEQLLIDKINDTRHPFGHGYVVAAILAGIPIQRFCFHYVQEDDDDDNLMDQSF